MAERLARTSSREDYALELHRDSVIRDTHCDTLKRLSPLFTHPRDAMWIDRSEMGLRSDFDGIPTTPKELEDVSKMPNITKELFRRRCPEDDIRKILGENHLRVFEEVVG